MHHLHFNHLAILAAALIQWVLGALWYALFFRKPWMFLTGHSMSEKPKEALFSMIWSFVSGLILSFVLAHIVIWSGAPDFGWGAFIGFLCWFGFIFAPLSAATLYERRPFALLTINSGYWLVALLISGGLLAAWR
jgi:hypothetical protein